MAVRDLGEAFWTLAQKVHADMGIELNRPLVQHMCEPVIQEVLAAETKTPQKNRTLCENLILPGKTDIIRKIQEAACAIYGPKPVVTDRDMEDMKQVAFDDYGFDDEHWADIKDLLVGREVSMAQHYSASQLEKAGYSSWKEYCISKSLDHY